MRSTVRYLSRGAVVEVADAPPTRTLLDHLRLDRHLTGTKEGCGEGDCGACTVAVGRLEDGPDGWRVRYRPVASCIQLLAQVDGAEVVTIEDLAAGGDLHPVQANMLALHGSQCGFCTPGIVMSLFALAEGDEAIDRASITDALAGNLCRCTGYRPIVEAALAAGHPAVPFATAAAAAALDALADADDLFLGDDTSFVAAPAGLASLADLYLRHPDATLVAGGTDVGLWITKRLATLPKIILLNRVAGLADLVETEAGLTIGAGVTFAAAEPALGRLAADLGRLTRRIGSRQVRAVGTLGGNIANGSPIGDSPPALIALGATLTLRRGDAVRTLPLEDYFLAYGRQDRAPSEFVAAIAVPRPGPDQAFRAFKLSKRFDQDISAVMLAVLVTLDGGRVAAARLACGGMAATPKRAAVTEAALVGADLADEATWAPALAALAADFAPITDVRASAAYRLDGARALLTKALIEIAGADSETRLPDAFVTEPADA
jgi:xanthine dehydrogenase small subunit